MTFILSKFLSIHISVHNVERKKIPYYYFQSPPDGKKQRLLPIKHNFVRITDSTEQRICKIKREIFTVP